MKTQKETYLNPSAKYGIVLDTEGYSCQPSYNVGFTVVDLQKLQIVESHSYAVPAYLEQNLTYNQEKNQRRSRYASGSRSHRHTLPRPSPRS